LSRFARGQPDVLNLSAVDGVGKRWEGTGVAFDAEPPADDAPHGADQAHAGADGTEPDYYGDAEAHPYDTGEPRPYEAGEAQSYEAGGAWPDTADEAEPPWADEAWPDRADEAPPDEAAEAGMPQTVPAVGAPPVADGDARRPVRRGPAVVGALVAAALLIGAFVFYVVESRGGKPVGGASCTWNANTNATLAKVLKKTGTPATKGLPAAGTREVTFTTNQGAITITLDLQHAPCGSASLAYLAGINFFDNTRCHRLTTAGIYVLQCGDPSASGSGGPSYTWEGENYPPATGVNYPEGVVAMAIPSNQDGSPATDLNGSQFFIVWKDTPVDPSTGESVLGSSYTIIGTVTAGMDVVKKIAAGGVYPTDPSIETEGTPKLTLLINSTSVGPIVAGSPH